jgi:hypothetical protein
MICKVLPFSARLWTGGLVGASAGFIYSAFQDTIFHTRPCFDCNPRHGVLYYVIPTLISGVFTFAKVTQPLFPAFAALFVTAIAVDALIRIYIHNRRFSSHLRHI